MKRILSAICCLTLCCLSALAQKEHAAKGAAMTDQDFINIAAQTDMMEAHLGQMAADQASSQDVKTYAQMLVTDHTADYQQLGTLAAKAGLTVPTGLDAAHNKMIAPFDKLKGAAFDSRYVQTMIAGHAEAIGVYTKESLRCAKRRREGLCNRNAAHATEAPGWSESSHQEADKVAGDHGR